MPDGEKFCVILARFLPDKLRYKIFFPKNFVHQHPQVMHLIIVDADENHAVFAQKIARE